MRPSRTLCRALRPWGSEMSRSRTAERCRRTWPGRAMAARAWARVSLERRVGAAHGPASAPVASRAPVLPLTPAKAPAPEAGPSRPAAPKRKYEVNAADREFCKKLRAEEIELRDRNTVLRVAGTGKANNFEQFVKGVMGEKIRALRKSFDGRGAAPAPAAAPVGQSWTGGREGLRGQGAVADSRRQPPGQAQAGAPDHHHLVLANVAHHDVECEDVPRAGDVSCAWPRYSGS